MALLTALAIGSGIGTAIKTGTGMYQASKIFDEDDEKRLKRLERLEAGGRLGLTEDERAIMQQRLSRPGLAAERQSRDILAAQQGIADVSAGTAARQQAAITDVAQKQKGEIAAQLEQQEMIAKQQDLAEIAALRQKKKDESSQFWGALAGGAVEGVKSWGEYEKAKLWEANQNAMKKWLEAKTEAAEGAADYTTTRGRQQLQTLWDQQ